MQISAEARWFWPEALPPGLEDWYRTRAGSCPPGGGAHREDVYLLDPGQVELGLKTRGAKPGVEIKGLVRVAPTASGRAPLSARLELWTKWTAPSLDLAGRPSVRMDKQRWLRKYDAGTADTLSEVALGADERPTDGRLPRSGCNVELTRVRLDDGCVWWTLGCESFGTHVDEIEANLGRALEHLAHTSPPGFGDAFEASYPTWLARHGAR